MSEIKLPVRKLKEWSDAHFWRWAVYDQDKSFVCLCNNEPRADIIVAALNHKCKQGTSRSWAAVEDQNAD